jgi:hypothetical protein
MSDNQYVFEIIRDVGYAIQNIKPHETVWFHVTNDGEKFFTARCSSIMPHGLSETSRAIEKAYQVTRGHPDPREVQYNELIMAVGNKYPGETRHETALRYIREAETNNAGPAQKQD